MFSKVITAGLAALIASPASAFIRFNCANNLVEERADPIVFPGAVASHAHKIVGGNGFGFNMTYDQARGSQCSSCPIKQDLSNYWTPKLYFQNADGTFQSVPTVGDNAQDLNGGQTVYYLQRGAGAASKTLKAFPPGFRMLAGDTTKRSFSNDFAGQAVSFACLGAGKDETNSLPNYNCPGGLRAQIFFPSCWDGVNLDSVDHKSHMSYPATGAYNNGASCPTTHPVELISLFFEVLYDTNSFASSWGSSKQPFVFSNGDASGYGFHGDFVNGWDVPTLQSVVDNCADVNNQGTLESCPVIQQYTTQEQNNCRLTPQINEQVKGTLTTLPGCNPVTSGPAAAEKNPVCTGQTAAVIGSAAAPFTDVSATKGWSYVGCGTDNNNPRTLNDKQSIYLAGAGDTMTVEWCMDFCSGYKYAGLEYASQCFCANTLPAAGAPQAGILGNCNMPCNGDSKELCGGPSALSIYTKCADGSTCQNAGDVAPTVAAAVSPSSAGVTSSSSSLAPVVVKAAGTSSLATRGTSPSSSSSSIVAPVKATATGGYSSSASSTFSTIIKAVASASSSSSSSATSSTPVKAVIPPKQAVVTSSSSSSSHTYRIKTVYVTVSASACN